MLPELVLIKLLGTGLIPANEIAELLKTKFGESAKILAAAF
jgi:hypothetical protein